MKNKKENVIGTLRKKGVFAELSKEELDELRKVCGVDNVTKEEKPTTKDTEDERIDQICSILHEFDDYCEDDEMIKRFMYLLKRCHDNFDYSDDVVRKVCEHDEYFEDVAPDILVALRRVLMDAFNEPSRDDNIIYLCKFYRYFAKHTLKSYTRFRDLSATLKYEDEPIKEMAVLSVVAMYSAVIFQERILSEQPKISEVMCKLDKTYNFDNTCTPVLQNLEIIRNFLLNTEQEVGKYVVEMYDDLCYDIKTLIVDDPLFNNNQILLDKFTQNHFRFNIGSNADKDCSNETDEEESPELSFHINGDGDWVIDVYETYYPYKDEYPIEGIVDDCMTVIMQLGSYYSQICNNSLLNTLSYLKDMIMYEMEKYDTKDKTVEDLLEKLNNYYSNGKVDYSDDTMYLQYSFDFLHLKLKCVIEAIRFMLDESSTFNDCITPDVYGNKMANRDSILYSIYNTLSTTISKINDAYLGNHDDPITSEDIIKMVDGYFGKRKGSFNPNTSLLFKLGEFYKYATECEPDVYYDIFMRYVVIDYIKFIMNHLNLSMNDKGEFYINTESESVEEDELAVDDTEDNNDYRYVSVKTNPKTNMIEVDVNNYPLESVVMDVINILAGIYGDYESHLNDGKSKYTEDSPEIKKILEITSMNDIGDLIDKLTFYYDRCRFFDPKLFNRQTSYSYDLLYLKTGIAIDILNDVYFLNSFKNTEDKEIIRPRNRALYGMYSVLDNVLREIYMYIPCCNSDEDIKGTEHYVVNKLNVNNISKRFPFVNDFDVSRLTQPINLKEIVSRYNDYAEDLELDELSASDRLLAHVVSTYAMYIYNLYEYDEQPEEQPEDSKYDANELMDAIDHFTTVITDMIVDSSKPINYTKTLYNLFNMSKIESEYNFLKTMIQLGLNKTSIERLLNIIKNGSENDTDDRRDSVEMISGYVFNDILEIIEDIVQKCMTGVIVYSTNNAASATLFSYSTSAFYNIIQIYKHMKEVWSED